MTENLLRLHLRQIPVTVRFNTPMTDNWERSISVEADVPLPRITRQEADDLVRLILDEWTFAAEDMALARSCPCGQSHLV